MFGVQSNQRPPVDFIQKWICLRLSRQRLILVLVKYPSVALVLHINLLLLIWIPPRFSLHDTTRHDSTLHVHLFFLSISLGGWQMLHHSFWLLDSPFRFLLLPWLPRLDFFATSFEMARLNSNRLDSPSVLFSCLCHYPLQIGTRARERHNQQHQTSSWSSPTILSSFQTLVLLQSMLSICVSCQKKQEGTSISRCRAFVVVVFDSFSSFYLPRGMYASCSLLLLSCLGGYHDSESKSLEYLGNSCLGFRVTNVPP